LRHFLKPRKGSVTAFAGAITLAVAVTLVARQFTPKPVAGVQLPLRRGGVTLARVDRAAKPGRHALPGDWVLATEKVRVAVGADVQGVERQLRYGAIVDLSARGVVVEKAIEIRPAVEVKGRAVVLRVDGIEPIAASAWPSLRIKHVSRESGLAVATVLALAPDKPWLDLVTTITNTGDRPLTALRVGDRIRWPGAPIFAPRLGFLKSPDRASVPWFARVGADLTHAVAFPTGVADVAFAFDRIGPSEQSSLLAPVELAPGGSHEYRRQIIVTTGGIERAAELAWELEQQPLGRVMGRLLPAPAWATVSALQADGRPVMAVRANRNGHFELPLPKGEYQLMLDAPGGIDRQRRIVVDPPEVVEATLMPPGAGRLRYSITDADGQLLSARFIVRGVPPTPDPTFGPAERSEGASNIFYTRSGEGHVELPPGRYRVTATHGPEYSIADEEVTLGVDKAVTLRWVLNRVVDTVGWLGCDFHLHAAPSPDSNVPVADRVVSLLAEGVEFAVPTDHNHVTDYSSAIEALEAWPVLGTTAGVEITTRSWGHFIAFPYPANAPPPPHTGVEPPELFAAARKRAPSAVLQVNHPRMPGIGYFNRGELDPVTGTAAANGFSFDFDTIEVVNGFELGQPNVIWGNVTEWFNLLNAGRRFTAVGNSDTHRLVHQWAGYPRTYVKVQTDRPDSVSPQEIAESLRGGHAIISNGPFVNASVNHSAGPGDLISTDEKHVELEVVVRAAEWVDVERADIYVNARIVQTLRPAARDVPERIRAQVQVALDQDSWIAVVVRGDDALGPVLPHVLPFALTNPIFVDADRDGIFTAPVQPAAQVAPAAGGSRSAR
jgi:hypothetical protein